MTLPRALRYLLVVGGAAVGILLFLLASASENSQAFDKYYSWLLGLNALTATTLLGLVLLLLGRLVRQYRERRFGSKLMTRLVLLFAIIGVLPGTLIFMVSVQFVSRSIESWFDVRVESALESGLNLGRAALEAPLNELSSKARGMALELSDVSDGGQISQLSRLRDQGQAQEATVFTASGRVVASVGGRVGTLVPDLPSAAILRQARMSRGFSTIEGGMEMRDDMYGDWGDEAPDAARRNSAAQPGAVPDEPGGLRLRVVIAIPPPTAGLSLQSETRYLQLLQPVPVQLATNALALRDAYSEYKERSLSRSGLRKMYISTLTLTLLLAIFGAIVSAFVISGDLAKPLLLLAEGTKAVAEGNLSPRPIVATTDELGTLTQSFNTMTKQLLDARTAVEKNRAELENAKAYLESVLANMSAGVMVFDAHFHLLTCNESVERILRHPFGPHIGLPLTAFPHLAPFADAIAKAFSEQSAQTAADLDEDEDDGGHLHWQKQIEIPRNLDDDATDTENTITLLARGSHLPVASGAGYIVVFDDISDVISAQRSIAWGEVARRLAHEIKNPLTPIQLSAERMQMKLSDKLQPSDAGMLTRATNTIVNQVAAMKRMVDDFRDYAKTPPAILGKLDLNHLIEDILHLYLGGEQGIIHPALAADLPHIMGDPTQLRQVIHNLLQNALDAVAERGSQGDEPPGNTISPHIDIATELIRYRNADGAERTAVRLTIRDNGPGFSQKILARAFEPYVTSKPRGTGLGLAMVKKIIDEHGGRIDLQNRSDGRGAKISILLLKLASND
jgi:nitrogen fixation/metabolism regulation signal transduction histidine kinase